jgi:putative ABC transport system substrate-binding protein
MQFDQLKRREFITLLGGAAAAWPLAARAQQVRRLGVLMNRVEADPLARSFVLAFEQQLHKLGWSEGQNLQTEYRWNGGDINLARVYASELLAFRPDVILSSSTANLTSLQRLSPTAPIVFLQVSDPVAQGFVVNMANPGGGNITGFASYEFTIGEKWLELLKGLVPRVKRVAVMFNPESSSQSKFFLSSIEAAAPKLDVSVTTLRVQSIEEIEPAIAGFARELDGGLILPTDPFTSVHHKHIIEVVARYRVPAISNANTSFVQDGGLMSYGPDTKDQFRQAAVYVDRILKGVKAGDLPIQMATKFNLAINLKTARTLGIEIPLSILLAVDEQIE